MEASRDERKENKRQQRRKYDKIVEKRERER